MMVNYNRYSLRLQKFSYYAQTWRTESARPRRSLDRQRSNKPQATIRSCCVGKGTDPPSACRRSGSHQHASERSVSRYVCAREKEASACHHPYDCLGKLHRFADTETDPRTVTCASGCSCTALRIQKLPSCTALRIQKLALRQQFKQHVSPILSPGH